MPYQCRTQRLYTYEYQVLQLIKLMKEIELQLFVAAHKVQVNKVKRAKSGCRTTEL